MTGKSAFAEDLSALIHVPVIDFDLLPLDGHTTILDLVGPHFLHVYVRISDPRARDEARPGHSPNIQCTRPLLWTRIVDHRMAYASIVEWLIHEPSLRPTRFGASATETRMSSAAHVGRKTRSAVAARARRICARRPDKIDHYQRTRRCYARSAAGPRVERLLGA